ncbi:ABC transporter ATP-binding protein [Halobaculum sp. MBLA0143]|uniref:ABC transporter ATP-binding protein n=1 Tax=Halobaculum sp. MBLA0143 TaxID=3079933 RepID=UPI0035268D63
MNETTPRPAVDADEPAVRVRDVSKTYGGEDGVTAVDGVSLTVERGSVVGLLGPNGAGKTTLMKSILGVVVPDEGTVELFGQDGASLGRDRYRYVSAMLEGARNIYWRMSLRENVRYFTGLQGIAPGSVREANTELISRLGMSEKLDEPVKEFSRGQKQRASLACVLAQRTPITFLDEPTLGLDVQAGRALQRELRDLASDEDRTVLLSSHDMDVVEELCDRVIVLDDGSVIAADTVAALTDVFDSQTYELALSGLPERDDRRALADRFESVSWDGEDARATVTVASGERLYDLMDALREADVVVESMNTAERDLEAAFVQVTSDTDQKEVTEAV